MKTITLYTKDGCHLCHRAKEVIERCRSRADFRLVEVDITSDPELNQLYCNDIPVIHLDGVEIARHFVRERNLLEVLQKQSAEGKS